MMSSPAPTDSALVYSLAAECHAVGSSADVARVCRDHPHLIPHVEAVLQVGRRVSAVGRAAAVVPTPLPTHVGRFALGEEVGRGGMGVVFRARDEELDRDIAVKLLRPDQSADAGATRRFVEEARVTGKLQHPGIPAVHQLGELPDGRPFLAMKLIEGRTLAALLASRDREGAGVTQWLGVFEGVCQAVGYAHAAGYVHRDLKPANVMVGAFGEVQVMDWGLAKVLASRERERPESGKSPVTHAPGSPLTDPSADTAPVAAADSERDTDHSPGTRAGTVLGTPAYMPPEQARGEVEHLDRRADVFALGAILCELLTGQPPLSGNVAQVIADCAVGRFDDAHRRLDSCGEDPALIALAKRCLSTTRDARPADASEVAAAVAAFRSESEARAKRAEVAAAEQRARRRVQTWASVIAGAILLAGVVGTSLGLWQAREAEKREATRADGEEKAKERAEYAYGKTADALDAMTSELTGDSLASQRALSDEQKQFLADVLTYYREFARADGASDVKALARTASIARRVSLIEHRLGRKREALANMRTARDLCRRLVADAPERDDLLQALAFCSHDLAFAATEQREWDEADDALRAAVGLFTRLSAAHPAEARFRYTLARCHNTAAILEQNRGRAGEDEYRKGVAVLERLVAEGPAADEYRQALAGMRYNLAHLLWRTDRTAEAEDLYRLAVADRETLAAAHPSRVEYRADLARARHDLASCHRHRREWEEAEKGYRAMVAAFERVVAERPGEPAYRVELARGYHSLGLLSLDRKRSDATEFLRKAVAERRRLTADHPADPLHPEELTHTLFALAQAHTDAGRAEEATAAHRDGLAVLGKLCGGEAATPALRTEWGQRHHNFAGHLADLKRHGEAAEVYRAAAAVFDRLAAEFPADPALGLHLARSHYNLGVEREAEKKLDEAVAAYRAAVPVIDRLVERGPTAEAGRRLQFSVHYNLGVTLRLQAKWADAERVFDGLLTITAKLVADYPADAGYRRDLGRTYSNLGTALKRQQKWEAGEAAYREAIGVRRRLTADDPTHGPDLAGSLHNLGLLLRDAGRHADSLEWFTAAIDTLTATGTPESPEVAATLRGAYSNRAQVYDLGRQYDRAVEDWGRVIELVGGDERANYQTHRARSQVHAGRVADGVAAVEAMTKSSTWTTGRWVSFAGVYAVASAKADGNPAYADRAMQMLRQAVKIGYKDTTRLRQESDLDPLREREDFKKLVAELEAKFPPKREVLPAPRAAK